MCLGNRKEKGERREEEREKQKEGGCQEVREEGTERGRVKGKKREGRFFFSLMETQCFFSGFGLVG